MSDISEKEPLTPQEIDERAEYWEKETLLSPQEAAIVARLKSLHKHEIAEELNIEKSQLESIRYNRIPNKLAEAKLTVDEMHGQFKYLDRHPPRPHPHARAIIGCSGPDCEEDVNTATQNPSFEDYYTKTINFHDKPSRISNEKKLQFCSLDCLNHFEELARR